MNKNLKATNRSVKRDLINNGHPTTNDKFKTAEDKNQRIALLEASFNAVVQLTPGGYPYPPENGALEEWTVKYHSYTEAISLLEQLSAREFMAIFTGYTMLDGDEAFYSDETTELINRYGSDEPLGDRVLELLDAIDKGGDTSWGIWMIFYEYLTTISEYMALTTGEANRFNDFRIQKGIPDFWKVA